MKKFEYKVIITMPKGDFLGNGEKYLQELIQSDFDVEDVGRWKVKVQKNKGGRKMTKEEIHAKAVDNADKRIKDVDKNTLSAIADYDRGLIKGYEDGAEQMLNNPTGGALLYAVEKTAERTKREVIKKAADWFEKYLFDIGYPDDWCRDSKNLISGKDRFIKAMNK